MKQSESTLLSLFRERFIHTEGRHVNWHVQGRNNTLHHRVPSSNLPWRFYLGCRAPHSSPQVAIHAFNAPRPGRLFRSSPLTLSSVSLSSTIRPMELSPGRELSPLFRCLIAASNCLICSTMWIRSITGRSTRFTVCWESDTV